MPSATTENTRLLVSVGLRISRTVLPDPKRSNSRELDCMKQVSSIKIALVHKVMEEKKG